jgi:hypothetical protein
MFYSIIWQALVNVECTHYNYKIVTFGFFQVSIVRYFIYFHDLLTSTKRINKITKRSLDRTSYYIIESTTQT